jgi:hypothetical protein
MGLKGRVWVGLVLVCAAVMPLRANTIFSAGTPTTLLFDELNDSLVVQIFYGSNSISFPVGGESFSTDLSPLAFLGFHFTDVDIYDPAGALSDTIMLHNNVFSFQSEAPGITLTPTAGADKIIETGGIQDAGNLTWTGFALIPGGSVDVKFRSDVPEPMSDIALGGAGLLVALARRRSRRVTRPAA